VDAVVIITAVMNVLIELYYKKSANVRNNDQQEIEQMDKKHTKFITALADLYKVIFKSESTKEVDFLLESLHEKGEAIRRSNDTL
jgi:hypothetical protein